MADHPGAHEELFAEAEEVATLEANSAGVSSVQHHQALEEMEQHWALEEVRPLEALEAHFQAGDSFAVSCLGAYYWVQ